jgi:uncharacterized phage-associated protein
MKSDNWWSARSDLDNWLTPTHLKKLVYFKMSQQVPADF